MADSFDFARDSRKTGAVSTEFGDFGRRLRGVSPDARAPATRGQFLLLVTCCESQVGRMRNGGRHASLQQKSLKVFAIDAEQVRQRALVTVMPFSAVYHADPVAAGGDRAVQQFARLPRERLFGEVVAGKLRCIDSDQTQFAAIVQVDGITIVNVSDMGDFIEPRRDAG